MSTIIAQNQHVGVTPFPARRVESKTASGLTILGQGLVPLRVVIEGGGYGVGDTLYVSSEDSVHAWATRRLLLKDSQSLDDEGTPFILMPLSAVKLAANDDRYSVVEGLVGADKSPPRLIKQL